MAELILHHYPMSPFSEKVRKVLAFKGVPWRAVEQPMWNPKPKLTPLTGGYRRIPVMQIGADVYCDTGCILRTIESLHPSPTLFPVGQRGTAELIAWWSDRQLFGVVVTLVLAAIGHTLPAEFRTDREAMLPGFKIDAMPALAPHARSQFRVFCRGIDRQLEGRPFLLGDAFSLADAACFHSLWFARMDPETAAIAAAEPRLAAWFARVEAIGDGAGSPLTVDEALAIARDATPATAVSNGAGDPDGIARGDRITVTPDDYAFDPVAGEVIAIDIDEVAIHRRDPEVGDVVVHFPRAGFRVAAA